MMSELDVARTMKAEIELLIPKSNPGNSFLFRHFIFLTFKLSELLGNRSRGVLKRLLTCCFSPTDCTSAVKYVIFLNTLSKTHACAPMILFG